MRKLLMVFSAFVCTPSYRQEGNEWTLPGQHCDIV
jgi:hypothetical protein